MERRFSLPEPTLACRLTSAGAALVALLVLAIPLLAAVKLGCIRRIPCKGRNGSHFDRLTLDLSAARGLRWLRRFGAEHWPALCHIVQGKMAWVGPRPLHAAEVPPPELGLARQAVLPGLFGLWSLRQRTLIDYGTEWEADAEYLRKRGPRFDIGILLRHAVVMCVAPSRRGSGTPTENQDVHIVDVRLDNVTMDEAITGILARMEPGATPSQVCFVNPACVNIAARQRSYRMLLRRAAMVLPDGIGIKIAGDMLATPMRQNVNGTDLFPRLCAAMEGGGHGIYLLGGRPGVADAMVQRIQARFPGVRINGHHHGYFDQDDEHAVAELLAAIRNSGASLLLVAMGVPMQDHFIARHLDGFGVRVAMGVGGLFDFMSGMTPRAPAWLREMGGEWLYRLAVEPGRMWKRYLIGNCTFLARVALQRCGLRTSIRCRIASAVPSHGLVSARAFARHCILFATTDAPREFPLEAGMPAAVMPVGNRSALEHILMRLAEAGCDSVDLVASDRPELIRAVAGDGARWGISVRLHLATSTCHPYAILQREARSRGNGSALLIGHVDTLPGVAQLRRLFETPARLILSHSREVPTWSGWASCQSLDAELAHLDRAALHSELSRLVPALLADEDSVSRVGTISAWANAQADHLAAVRAGVLPLVCTPMAWGGLGAGTRLAPGSVIHGPALIGERCWLGEGVEIGPNVTLGDDVVIGAGTRLHNTTVLSGSNVGANLDLKDSIVGHRSIYSLRWQCALTPPPGDGILAPLGASANTRVRLASRMLAFAVVATLAPLGLLYSCGVRLGMVPSAWVRREVVGGRDPASLRFQLASVRVLRAGHGMFWAFVLGALGGALDICAGRRCWVGPRPRALKELSVLPRDWQDLLMNVKPGLLHAPVLHEWPSQMPEDVNGGNDQDEMMAVADIFGIVNRSRFVMIRIALQQLRLHLS